jgi:hypothetical protein
VFLVDARCPAAARPIDTCIRYTSSGFRARWMPRNIEWLGLVMDRIKGSNEIEGFRLGSLPGRSHR